MGAVTGERGIEVERRLMGFISAEQRLDVGRWLKAFCGEISFLLSLGNKSSNQIIEFYFFTEKLLRKK